MHFEPQHIYHVYNRGNNKVPIFFNTDNYIYFLRKLRNEWLDYCNVLCYCLMPNHFHFMLLAKPEGCEHIKLEGKVTAIQKLSKVIGKTLSSYTLAINKQNKTTGTLFQKKTKAKCLTDEAQTMNIYSVRDYLSTCFHYIHNNPIEANLVTNLADWHFSSWPDYCGKRNGTLCDKNLALSMLGYTKQDFLIQSNISYDAKLVELIL
jgi:putative transposase